MPLHFYKIAHFAENGFPLASPVSLRPPVAHGSVVNRGLAPALYSLPLSPSLLLSIPLGKREKGRRKKKGREASLQGG
jgi:hypothetical protein